MMSEKRRAKVIEALRQTGAQISRRWSGSTRNGRLSHRIVVITEATFGDVMMIRESECDELYRTGQLEVIKFRADGRPNIGSFKPLRLKVAA